MYFFSPEEFTENKDLIEDYAGGILALDAVQNEVGKRLRPCR